MNNDEYANRERDDKELLRQVEIKTLEKMIAETPPEQREKHKLVLGNRTFSLEQILAEAKEGTEYGELFLNMQAKSRLERMRRK